MIKKIKMSLTTISILATSVSAIEITSSTHAVDIAGKQRMFTQRMLKDYAMVGMGNTFGKPAEDLKKISADFQDHMESLASYTKSDEIKKSIEKVKTLWIPLKQTLSEAPSKEKVEKLQVDLDVLLKAADDTTKLFAKESGKASGETVNKAGRQRMLSQRMATFLQI
jgi:nitrate/nitrite-specific signal transduction histidine kinase